MKARCVYLLGWCAFFSSAHGFDGTSGPTFSTTTGAISGALLTSRTETLNLCAGRKTKLRFPHDTKVDEIRKSSSLLTVEFDPAENVIAVSSRTTEGKSEFTVRVDNRTYHFEVVVTLDPHFPQEHNYTFSDGADQFDSAVAQSPHLRPFEVDTVRTIKIIEKARFDTAFRETLEGFRTIPIGRSVSWNTSPITLIDVTQFADSDLLAFKIEWSNATRSVLNLESNQIRLHAGSTEIPVTASQQRSSRLFPGQTDIVWLFVQGYRLSARNDWSIVLPIDSDRVARRVQRP